MTAARGISLTKLTNAKFEILLQNIVAIIHSSIRTKLLIFTLIFFLETSQPLFAETYK